MPDLVARPLSAPALSDLLDRKPHLLRPLAARLLPPPLAARLLPPPLASIDPAARLGIDLASLRTAEDFRQALSAVLMAVARGEIAPAETAVFMLDGCVPLCRWWSWQRRTSSSVAVSGERRMKAANDRTWRM